VAVPLDGHFGLYRIAAQEPVEIPSHAALLPIFRLSKVRGVRIAVPQWPDNQRATPER
jgi:hypothetical protein